jgi:hypothetical protein
MKTSTILMAAVCLLAVAHSAQAWSWNFGPFRRSMSEKEVLPNYQQCGGIGGACNSSGYTCTDAKWVGVECEKNSECKKLSQHYHMCQPKVSGGGDAITKKAVEKDGITYLQPWNQCGGKTGDCKEHDDGCRDCPFPKTQCVEGYVCYRVVEHFWQCGPEEQYKDQALYCEGGDAPAPAPGYDFAITERTCEAPLEDHAVQGKRYKAIQMKAGEDNYDECCDSCAKDDECVAFHLNEKSKTEVVCALFSEFGDVVEHEAATAGLMAGTVATMAG